MDHSETISEYQLDSFIERIETEEQLITMLRDLLLIDQISKELTFLISSLHYRYFNEFKGAGIE